MTTLSDRLKQSRKNAGLTQSALAKAVGITQPTYQALETGKVTKSSYLLQIAEVLKVDTHWLATGQGEMIVTPTPFDPTKLHGYATIETWDDDTPLDDDEVVIPFYKELAFACGHGADGEAHENEWRRLRFSRMTLNRLGIYQDQTFAATARDDSMTPTIHDGDTIFVDKGRSRIKDGKIFAVEHGGLFYCKRLYNLPNGGVRVVSDNDVEFPEYTLNREQIVEQQFRVIGWVYSISRLERW